MKLKDYIIKLNEIAAKHPDVEVVYAKDEEGNGFKKLAYDPSLGNFKGDDFIPKGQFKDFGGKLKINAVCLN